MKTNSYLVPLSLLLILGTSSFRHPVKLTSSLIEYDSNKNELEIQCRVFIDDFENTIDQFENIFNSIENGKSTSNLDVSSLSQTDLVKIEFYFDKYYQFRINERKLALKYETSELFEANNMMNLVFSVKNVALEKGDELTIENMLFFEEFGSKQMNRMAIRIPPFVLEDNHIATLDNYIISYLF